MKIKDATGKEIDVFTQEELDKKIEEAKKEIADSVGKEAAEKAIEDYKEKNPDKTEEIEKLKDDLAEAESKLEKEEDDDKGGKQDTEQVKRLREAREKAEKELKEGIEGFSKEISDLKDNLIGDTKTELLDKLSGGDDELKKKIEFEFDNYRTDDTTKKDIIERMAKAHQLVTGNTDAPDIMDGMTGSQGAKGEGSHENKETEVSDNSKNIGNIFKITDEDRKAHAAAKKKG